ncbi:unnamed protein product [marine sediment metagenome]|uniref:Dit-like phage tail protein N-terminal domain-containing protein n=1 Tax=marine sediment metagenome TaxID=412755 RepID=X1DBP8_9ZZZZ
MRVDGEPITVITSLREYPNMAITTLAVTRDATTGNVLSSSVSLEQMLFATTETVELPKPVTTSNKKSVNKGKKVKKPADDVKANKADSVLSGLYGL